MADIYDMIAGAAVFGQGTYIKPGKGTLILSRLILKQGHKGTSLIPEFLVESSEGPEANAPGTSCSKPWNLSDPANAKYMMGFAKEFFGALVPDCTDFAADLREATSDAQPLRGYRVRFEAFNDVTKTKKTTITKVLWRTYENDEASVKDGIAKLTAAGL